MTTIGREGGVHLSARVNFWSTVVTAAAAAAALLLSGVTYVQLNVRPAVTMMMPQYVRISSVLQPGSRMELLVDLQPTFRVDKKSDVTAAVTHIVLQLSGPAAATSTSIELPWVQTIEVSEESGGNDTPAIGTIYRKYKADPVPFSVTQESAVQEMMEFRRVLASNQRLSPGVWTARLTVQRYEQDPLIRNFCMNLTEDLVASVNNATSWSPMWPLMNFSATPPQESGEVTDTQCYRLQGW
jgi:hypothetical protein